MVSGLLMLQTFFLHLKLLSSCFTGKHVHRGISDTEFLQLKHGTTDTNPKFVLCICDLLPRQKSYSITSLLMYILEANICLFVTREGHQTLIEEASQQLPCQPDVVIVSVGGGGLLNGVLMGMKKVGWEDIPCVAMETKGADCLNASLTAKKLVTLPDITRYSVQ